MNLPTAHWTAHRTRLDAEREEGWLSPAQYDAAIAIAELAFAGDTRPTNAQIAKKARVDVRTVQRTRKVLKELGLLLVHPRFERIDGRRQQRASENELIVPRTPVAKKPKKPRKPRPPRGRQGDEASKEESIRKRALEGLAWVRSAAVDPILARIALAEVASRRMRALGVG